MKTRIMAALLLTTVVFHTHGQQFSEKINKELSFEKPGPHTLMVFNINGSISVAGISGEKVIVEVTKTIRAKTDRRLELGKTSVQLGVTDRADTLMLYVEGICSQFGQSKNRRNGNKNSKTNAWGYVWNQNNNDDCEEEFDYDMDFVIKVPAGVSVYASTVNNGDISVENVSGTVYTHNINGSISLKNISGQTDASTINGSVDLEYSKNPLKECRYYSLNGDINAAFRKGLTANLSFESFNGELYTNLELLQSMPILVEKVPVEKGIKYKITGNRFKVGNGGVALDFETFNGNAYVKELN